MFVVIYFMIRPQQKKLKRKEFESTLKVGDKIITGPGKVRACRYYSCN
jgi:preprotein translocase subunit YajC